MYKTLALLLLVGCGGSFPTATHCDSQVYRGGVDSVLPIDCDVFEADAELAVQMVVRYTSVTETEYRARMRHVHIEIRSISSWDEFGTNVGGYTQFNRVNLPATGWSLVHESLHAYDMVTDAESIGGWLSSPVEAVEEFRHSGWDKSCTDSPGGKCGYLEAEANFNPTMIKLQSESQPAPPTTHAAEPVPQG